jgi:hypothetical protein
MITRRPYSRTATRGDHLAEDPRNAQVTAAEVKEQAESLLENLGGRWPGGGGPRARRRVMTMIMAQ